MGRSSFDASSWREAARNIEIVVDAGRKGMEKALPGIGIEATNVIKVLLTHPPISVPGEPPGLRTGGLRLSYNYDVSNLGRSSVLRIGSDAATRRPISGEAVDYAKYLEFGTRTMAPRPHLRPAIAIILPTIAPTLAAACVAAQKAAASGLKGISL